jgi:HK97 family phage prohead protease
MSDELSAVDLLTIERRLDAMEARERDSREHRAWRKFLSDAQKLTERFRAKARARKVYKIPPRKPTLPRKALNGATITKEMTLPTTYAVEQSSRVIRCIISTSDTDRVGDQVLAEGCDASNYMRNPIVLLNHDHDKMIGRCTELKIAKGRIVATIELAEDVPDADRALRLIEQGALKGISIGFDPTDEPEQIMSDTGKAGFRFHSWELLEVSIVAVPANPNALIL